MRKPSTRSGAGEYETYTSDCAHVGKKMTILTYYVENAKAGEKEPRYFKCDQRTPNPDCDKCPVWAEYRSMLQFEAFRRAHR